METKPRVNKTEPSRLKVHKTLREIIKHASVCAQKDYKHSLGGLELRALTAIYVRRAADILEDSDLSIPENNHPGKGGVLCLGPLSF